MSYVLKLNGILIWILIPGAIISTVMRFYIDKLHTTELKVLLTIILILSAITLWCHLLCYFADPGFVT